MELDPNFFSQSTIEVAPQLLGKVLTYDHPDGRITGVINEVEAYTEDDPSCHAFNGRKTHRNAPMFGAPGTVYIYMIYGMYYCLNIVTESKGRGCAVLIRSVIGLEGRTLLAKHRHCREDRLDTYLNGPGKLMKGFQIPVDLNYSSLFDLSLIHI